MAGISVWHQQAIQAVGGVGLTNPRMGARVVQVLKALDKLYKRESTAKLPFTADMFVQILYLGFQQNTMGVRHNELLFVLLAAGPFRPNAAVNIVVQYDIVQVGGKHTVRWIPGSDIWVERRTTESGVCVRLVRDKNVSKANQRVVAIPEEFFGVNVIDLLEDYLVRVRPPSGGRLLASPKEHRKLVPNRRSLYLRPGQYIACNGGAYTATCDAVRRAVKRTGEIFGWEGAEEQKYGGGSPRKTTADLLYACGHTKKMIADVGGWMLREDAADLYLRANEVTRRQVLRQLMGDLVLKGQLQPQVVQQARAKRQEARQGEMQEMDGAEEEQPVQGWFTLARWRRAL